MAQIFRMALSCLVAVLLAWNIFANDQPESTPPPAPNQRSMIERCINELASLIGSENPSTPSLPSHRSIPDTPNLGGIFPTIDQILGEFDLDRHAGHQYGGYQAELERLRTESPALSRWEVFTLLNEAGINPADIASAEGLGTASLSQVVRIENRSGQQMVVRLPRTSLGVKSLFPATSAKKQKSPWEILLDEVSSHPDKVDFVKFFKEHSLEINQFQRMQLSDRLVRLKSIQGLKNLSNAVEDKIYLFQTAFFKSIKAGWKEGAVELAQLAEWKKYFNLTNAFSNEFLQFLPLLFESWRQDLKTSRAKPISMDDLLYVRDYLLKIFISGGTYNDQAYHLLIELRDFPVKVLTPQLFSHAQALAAARLKSLGIVPTWVGSMMVQDLGTFDASAGDANTSRQRALTIKDAAQSDAPVFGYKKVLLGRDGGWSKEIYLLNPSLRQKHHIVFEAAGEKKRRIWEKIGIGIGSTSAYYRDIETGLVISICVDALKTQAERQSEWVSDLKKEIDALIQEKKKSADIIGFIDAKIDEIPPELRKSIISELKGLYQKNASEDDWSKLVNEKRVSFWTDTLEQLAEFKGFVENFRELLPEEATQYFPIDEKNQPLGFRITPEGSKVAREWLKKAKILVGKDEDIESYLKALATANVLSAWSSLPIDRAILSVFREGIFDHSESSRSHLHVLRIVSARLDSQNKESGLSEEAATKNYVEAITQLDKALIP